MPNMHVIEFTNTLGDVITTLIGSTGPAGITLIKHKKPWKEGVYAVVIVAFGFGSSDVDKKTYIALRQRFFDLAKEI